MNVSNSLVLSGNLTVSPQNHLEDDIFDAEEAFGGNLKIRNMPGKRSGKNSSLPHTRLNNFQPDLADTNEEQFRMTYKAARHEAIWLEDSLKDFFLQKWFDDVLRMVKGGKEASVYLCLGNQTTEEDFLAAKVYRPRRFRNLKNDGLYREGRAHLDESGRQITNHGKLHAITKRTEYGRELMHTSWLEHEMKTLSILYEAGADVPRPFASDSNAILMEYFGDEVMSAPTLNDVDLSLKEAKDLFDRVLFNIDLMLSKNRIHGDLSAFNILYWNGKIVLIDFPQAVHPEENRSAYPIFERDVMRVCEYFDRQGVRSQPQKIAEAIWRKHQDRMIPQIDPKVLGEDQEDERDLWEDLKNA